MPEITTQDRFDTIARIRTEMPELDDDTALRYAEWLLTGSAPLDPERLEDAAKKTAETLGYKYESADVKNRMRGMAQAIVVAYMQH